MKAQYPAPITDFRVKFWRYTLGDLARIGIPLLSGAYAAGIAGALLGAVVGFGLAELQIYGKTVDKILVDLILSQVGKSQIATSVETADEAIITEDGTAVGVVEVSSVDLDMASDMDWQVNRDTVANLYREIEEPVEIHSRKRRVDLSGYQCIRDSAVTTDHYLIVKEQPGSEPEPKVDRIKSVADKCRGIRNSLNAGDLSAEHITGKSLMDVLRQLHPPDPSLNEIIDSTVSSLEDLTLTDISPEPSHYKTGIRIRISKRIA